MPLTGGDAYRVRLVLLYCRRDCNSLYCQCKRVYTVEHIRLVRLTASSSSHVVMEGAARHCLTDWLPEPKSTATLSGMSRPVLEAEDRWFLIYVVISTYHTEQFCNS